MIRITKKCEHCGERFNAQDLDDLFCGKRCEALAIDDAYTSAYGLPVPKEELIRQGNFQYNRGIG